MDEAKNGDAMSALLKAWHRLIAPTTFLVILFCIVVVANSPNLTAQTKTQTEATHVVAVAEALQTSFGSALEAAKSFQPFYLTGDFNGDGAQDTLIVAWIKGRQNELAPGIRVINPFDYGVGRVLWPSNPAAKPMLAMAIIHGDQTGWKTAAPAGKFLLVGESPILILETDRALSIHPQDRVKLMEVMSRRAKRRRGSVWPPRAAKGDSILLPTEATDSILYWNGKTYRWEEGDD
jgi:hypothetical protein